MDYSHILLLWTWGLLPGLHLCFNFDTKNPKLILGSKDAQFGYTIQQHQVGGRQWLLVGAPFETSGKHETGDVYRCPLDTTGNCSRLHLGKMSLDNVSERKDKMRLGMTLSSNPKDSSFVTCGPLWSHECGSSYYSTGICSRVSRNFKFSRTIAPALQRCETFMDIVIVLDGSNSIYPWYEVQHFLINILNKFYIGPGQTQVGVVQYGSRVVHEFNLKDYQTVEDVVDAARNIHQRGGEETRTALGINVARAEAFERGGRRGAKKVMIVITDGESHDSQDLVQAVGDSEKDNITMYAIAVLGYYNRRGINPEAFLKEIKFIASDPDEDHFFNVTDESALKDIVDALGERIFSLEGTKSQGQGFNLQMAQAGFSSHIVQDGVLVGAVGAYDWTGAVLKDTKLGKVVPPRSSYLAEFPEELKNHGAYLGYSVSSLMTRGRGQLYVGGAPRFNHTGKVIIFTLSNQGNLTILQSLLGEQIGSYFGSELLSVDIDADGQTDVLLVSAPMFLSGGWERGRVYIYSVRPKRPLVAEGFLEVSERSQNSRLGSALTELPDMNGDGLREVVVGAPLEDDHQGAIYVFYGKNRTIQRQYIQRVSASALSLGLQYFGRSVHGVLDVNKDGLVDLAVGALGAAVIIWSRGMVRIQTRLTFEPEKVNIFNRDCRYGGKEVTCMSAIACLSLEPKTGIGHTSVEVWYSVVLDEKRFPARAVLDESERQQQPRRLTLQTGQQNCDRLSFYVQETTDYGRPIMVFMETGLQTPDEGPVLDPDWPTSLRTQLPFWNGCEQEERCVPDLILQTRTDLLEVRQFCSVKEERAGWSLCGHQGASLDSGYVVEAGRRRVVVYARLENQGENAYRTTLNISYSTNLAFSSLIVKDQSDIQMECHNVERRPNQKMCNISTPFLKSLAQVSFRLEFEFSRSVVLDHVRVVMETGSEGEEGYPEDNISDLHLPLRYPADLLFTRDASLPPQFDIRAGSSSASWSQTDFNLTYQVQNLGFFSVSEVMFWVDVWAVTPSGNQLVNITDYSIEPPSAASHCVVPDQQSSIHTPEDLSHLSQLNQSNSVSIGVECRLSVPAYREVKVMVRGQLQLHTLLSVKFRSLGMLVSASIQLSPSSPMFLQEERPLRQIVLEMRREDEVTIPFWVILGSSLGGLLLLALLVLALWKLGFFNRRRREEEEEEQEPVANGKPAAEL